MAASVDGDTPGCEHGKGSAEILKLVAVYGGCVRLAAQRKGSRPIGIADDALRAVGQLISGATRIARRGGDPGRVARWSAHPNPVQRVGRRGSNRERIASITGWARTVDLGT